MKKAKKQEKPIRKVSPPVKPLFYQQFPASGK